MALELCTSINNVVLIILQFIYDFESQISNVIYCVSPAVLYDGMYYSAGRLLSVHNNMC